MKTLTTFILSLTIISHLLASVSDSKILNSPATKITGHVIEKNNNSPVEYANIVLYNQTDSSIITGTVSDINGKFNIDKIQFGKYYLTVDFIGYQKLIINEITIDKNNPSLDVGEVKLELASVNLEEVLVTGDKNYVDFKIDKKIVNVSRHINAAGGTVADVLENVPSVNVDIEGNVTLRGSSSYTILIDGKPSVLSGSTVLKQIPANTVENIEIITNPSAKYDPEGTAGIINIIMKKGLNDGLNGIISSNYATWDKFGGEINLNFRKSKFNYFVSADYNWQPNHADSRNDRETYFSDTAYVFEKTKRIRIMRPFKINSGFDYNINDKNSLTLSATYGGWGMDRLFDSEYFSYSTSSQEKNYSLSNNDFVIDGLYYAGNLNYQHLFNEKGHKLDFNVTAWNWNSKQGENSFEQNANGQFVPMEITNETRTNLDEKRNNLHIKTDYSLPFKTGKFEFGAETRFARQNGNFTYETKNLVTNIWEDNDNFSNESKFHMYIYALYGTYSNSIGGFNYQLGLRGEITDRNTIQLNNNKEYEVKLQNLYPSVHISRDLSQSSQMQASYSRRINRPQPWQLNPYPGYTDSYNYFEGNPLLKPEDTDAFELNFQSRLAKLTFSSGIFVRFTSNTQEMVQKIEPEQPNIVYLTFDNIDKTKSLGLEYMFNYVPSKILNINLSGNVYRYNVRSNFNNEENDNTSINWDSRLNTNVNITKSTRAQFVAVYNSPSVHGQGTTEALYFFDLAIRQSFLKNKLNISLHGHNIFSTGIFESNVGAEYFNSWFEYIGESPVVRLNVSFMINNYKPKRRENTDIGAGAT